MRDHWYESEVLFLKRYRGVKHRITLETSLHCRKGIIWAYDERGNYRAGVFDNRAANKLGELLGQRTGFKPGEEGIFRFTEKDLPLVIKLLAPFRLAKDQIFAANSFR